MKFTDATPRVKVTIADNQFDVPAPYVEGHVMTANEASAFNQTFRENIRNNLAKAVKDGLTATPEVPATDTTPAIPAKPAPKTFEQLQAEVLAYAAEYEFGVGGGGRVTDPIEREAIAIATGLVKDALKRKGIEITKETVDKFVAQVLETKPEVRKQAEKIVKQRQTIGKADLGDIFA